MTRAVVCLLFLLATAAYAQVPPDLDQRPGGLAVHVGAPDAGLALELAKTGRWLILVLAGEAKVPAIRDAADKAGAAGVVTVGVLHPGPLPLADHMANLVVVDPSAKLVRDEVLRVLVPVRGRGYLNGRTLEKPMPATMDHWSHFFHDATGNKVSRDTALRVPNALRWIGGPRLQDSNGANGWRLNDGLAVSEWNYTLKLDKDERRMVVEGRDAFNGTLLWQKVESIRRGGMAAMKTKPLILADGRLLRLVDGETVARLAAVDPATGEVKRLYQSSLNPRKDKYKSWYPQFSYHDGVIVQINEKNIRAIDAETDKPLWDHTHDTSDYLCRPIFAPDLGLVVVIEATHNDRFHLFRGRYPSAICEALVAFDVKTGKVKWRTPADPRTRDLTLVHPKSKWDDTKKWSKVANSFHAISYYNGRIFCLNANDANGGKPAAIWAVDARDGGSAWVNICGPPMKDASMFDLYALPDGTIFTYGHDWARMDQATGKLLAYGGTGGNARCDTGAATVNLVPAGFGNYFDISSREEVRWTKTDLARGQCGGWGTPAYGMVYYHGSGCGCFFPIRGNLALHRTSDPVPVANDRRHVKGPAFGAGGKSDPSAGWPEYLYNGQRRAWTPDSGPGQLKETWSVKLAEPLTHETEGVRRDWLHCGLYNGPLTAPVIADGRLLLADRDGGLVHALDATTGKRLWSYRADGRVITPPTLRDGLAVFGTRAGTVHCLDAATGKLVWRFMAAPQQRYLIAYGQVESVWPLHGCLPVVNGTVVATAGYHGEADGGIWAWGLDLGTGAIKWSRILHRPARPWMPHDPGGEKKNRYRDTEHELGYPNKSNGAYHPTYTRNIDLPTSDGTLVEVANTPMNPGTGKVGGVVKMAVEWHGERFPFLDMSFEDRGGPHGTGSWGVDMGRYTFHHRDGPRRLAHDGNRMVCVKPTNEYYKEGPCLYRVTRDVPVDKSKRLNMRNLKPIAHTHTCPGEGPDSLVVGGGTAYVTTEGHLMKPWGKNERPRGRWFKGEPLPGVIEAFDIGSGKKLATVTLASAVINNGLAVASGRLYAVCEDGTVRCFGP